MKKIYIFLVLIISFALVGSTNINLTESQLKGIPERRIIVPYSLDYINSLSERDYQILLKGRGLNG